MLCLLVCIDQLAQCFLKGLWWVVTGRGVCPDPDETISGVLGRYAARGDRWAVFPAAFVDGLFLILTLGHERNHCASVLFSESACGKDSG